MFRCKAVKCLICLLDFFFFLLAKALSVVGTESLKAGSTAGNDKAASAAEDKGHVSIMKFFFDF